MVKITKKYALTGKAFDFQRKGRKSKFLKEHWDFIDEIYHKNDETTAQELKNLLLKHYDIEVSIAAVKNVRKKLGWKKSGPKYCQAVRPLNCYKRELFARDCIESNEDFDNVIFTDESSIELNRHSRLSFQKRGMPSKLKPKVKHPFKVHVSGGISRRERTKLVIFTGIMRKVSITFFRLIKLF